MLDLYEGRHWLRPIRNGRSMLTVNYPRVVVDKAVSYLLGEGLHFAVPGREQGLSESAAAAAERVLYDIYQDGDVDAQDQQTALQSVALGDGFQKVYWDAAAEADPGGRRRPDGAVPGLVGRPPGEFWRIDSAYRIQADEANRCISLRSRTGCRLAVVAGCRWSSAGPPRRSSCSSATSSARRGRTPTAGCRSCTCRTCRCRANSGAAASWPTWPAWCGPTTSGLSDQADTIRYHADPPTIFKGVAEHTDLAVGPGTVWDIPVDASVELLEWRGTAPDGGGSTSSGCCAGSTKFPRRRGRPSATPGGCCRAWRWRPSCGR